MSRFDAGSAKSGIRVPGAYVKLLLAQCELETQPGRRLLHELDGAQWERAKELAAQDASALFEERLTIGEPITVPKWMIGGHNVPAPKDVPLFRDRSVRSYKVFPDDRVEVAERDDPQSAE